MPPISLAREWKRQRHASWRTLDTEFANGYMHALEGHLVSAPAFNPASNALFSAFRLTPLSDVRVVIMGHDPYTRQADAMGLSFSVPCGNRLPGSLRSIYDEVSCNVKAPIARCGDLTHWAQQGVLLLNSILTVQTGGPAGSHRNWGWEQFTDQVMMTVSKHRPNAVFCLWGRPAQRRVLALKSQGASPRLLLASHPDRRSASTALRARPGLSACGAFLGCQHFSKINKMLGSACEIRW